MLRDARVGKAPKILDATKSEWVQTLQKWELHDFVIGGYLNPSKTLKEAEKALEQWGKLVAMVRPLSWGGACDEYLQLPDFVKRVALLENELKTDLNREGKTGEPVGY
jgi:hypothetical protein